MKWDCLSDAYNVMKLLWKSFYANCGLAMNNDAVSHGCWFKVKRVIACNYDKNANASLIGKLAVKVEKLEN